MNDQSKNPKKNIKKNKITEYKDCPYCFKPNKIQRNWDDYQYKVCDNCGNGFFIKPFIKDMEKKIGYKPNAKHMLSRDDIKDMIDVMLDVKDFEEVERYRLMLESMGEEEYVIFNVSSEVGLDLSQVELEKQG